MGIIENNGAILGNNRSIWGEILNRIIGRKNRIIGTALTSPGSIVDQKKFSSAHAQLAEDYAYGGVTNQWCLFREHRSKRPLPEKALLDG